MLHKTTDIEVVENTGQNTPLDIVGEAVGAFVVAKGDWELPAVGIAEEKIGTVEGEEVDERDGAEEGERDGAIVKAILGLSPGLTVGDKEGMVDGLALRVNEGEIEGEVVGLNVGLTDAGDAEGVLEGDADGVKRFNEYPGFK